MEVLERLLAARATVEAYDRDSRGAPELGTRREGCGDCADRIQSNSLRVTRIGRVQHVMCHGACWVDDRLKEQVSKILNRERKREKNMVVLGSHES